MTCYIPLDRRKEIILRFQDAIKEHFGHWETSLIQLAKLDQITGSFIERVADIENSKGFILLLLEYLNQFNNAHTFCLDQTVEHIEFDITVPLGFRIELIENSWTITTSFISELIPGDRIEYIDDEPVDDFVKNQTKYFHELHNPLKTMRLNSFSPYLIDKSELRLVYRDKNDKLKNVSVYRNDLKIPFPKISGKWLDDSETAYIQIPSFFKPEYENDALELLKSYKTSKTLIVDVRGNQGGNTPHRLISALMNKPWRWWREKWKQDLFFSDSLFIQSQSEAYDGNLVILTDRNTFSSGEDFVMPFKDNKRAVIIGEKTFGSTGQPYFTTIDSILLSVGSKRVQLPDGTEFEGIGIEPDKQIDKKIEHLYKGEIVSSEISELISEIFSF